MARRFRTEMADAGGTAPLQFPEPVADGGTPKAAVLLIGAVIALLAYGGWYLTSMRGPDVANLSTAMIERTAPSADTSPKGGSSEPVRPLPTTKPPVSPPATADSARHAGSASVASPAPSPAVPPPPARQPEAVPSPAPPQPAPAATTALAAEPPDGGMPSAADPAARIVLRAKSDSWVEVRDPQSNSLLVARLLRPGDVYAVPDRPGLRLITGNAGGLIVIVDGEAVPPLGKEGAVRRGIALDPDLLRRGPEGGAAQ
ncbi:MAG TPA: DUF4115 domain-containing protein [Rhodospirillales bacterium]|nr:DUF4115 domain-containing protein [Rhodospirillales bacterium]